VLSSVLIKYCYQNAYEQEQFECELCRGVDDDDAVVVSFAY